MNKSLRNALLFTGVLALTGCAPTNTGSSVLTPEDEIITFEVPDSGKQIVRIGFAMNMDWDPLIKALDAQFPDKQFIYDYNVTSGVNLPVESLGKIVEKNDYDFVVASYWNAPLLGCDISNEPCLQKYLQTALDAIASNGKIYGIPLPTSATGVYYNKDLFAEKGWGVPPTSTSDFITLCKTIKEAGYVPFDCCYKYEGSLCRLLQGMLQDELFTKPDGMSWYLKLLAGKETFASYATKMFEMAKTMFDEGIFSLDSFSASLTKMRQDFFQGKIAMMDYSSDIYGLAISEKCPFNLGLAGYPSSSGKNSPVLYSSSAVLFVPSRIKQDSSRYAFATKVLDYLSTSEGQNALLTGWSGVPSLKNYQGTNALYNAVIPFIDKGDFRPSLDFAPNQEMIKPLKTLIRDAVKSIGTGTAVKEAISTLDVAYQKALKDGIPVVTYSKIAEASADLSVLATSYYEADKIKEATKADIALMPSGGFYRSNMAFINKGDISEDSRFFYQKGLGAKDFITTYSLSGAKLHTLLERPIINKTELDQFVAASGLAFVYAPWKKRGERISSLRWEDGTAFDENKNYTVAAYAGVIDASYLDSTLASFSDLGDPQTFMMASLKADKIIAPKVANRLTLDWSAR